MTTLSHGPIHAELYGFTCCLLSTVKLPMAGLLVDEERNGMFKLVPHCAKGSWIVSQSVGTTPVILGRKLATTYHQCDRYIEVDVDVASTQAVAYIVKMVQGATRSMLIDHAYLLEGQYQHELPETLIGAIRYKHLDMTDYTHINVDRELPFTPVVPGIVGQ
eukprot:GHRR01021823.1.p1 GENE.GHRR01021823.1~~GHRR01021823.1.p1  ORF type:complete len:162 (+),score=50.75 GHRR01021823.1:474-959(+)